MDGRSNSKRKAGGRQDPFHQLERGGGAVLAFKEGAGSLFELRHVGVREGNAEILGHMYPEGVLFEDRPVPVDELTRLGWRYLEPRGWERRWALRSDLDRTEMRRVVHATVALLAALHDQDARAYDLLYRPSGEEDAGSGQLGCFFAAVSSFVGDVLGLIVTAVRNEPIPLLAMSFFAGTVGFVAGFLAFGIAFPRLLAISTAFRGRAADITTGLMLVIPGVIVLSVWLLAPRFGPLNGDQLLAFTGALIVAVFVSGFIPFIAVLVRGQRRRR
jgi:hypothetical protein